MIGDILQPTHLLFILVVALLVLGPKRLPEVARSLGRGIRDFKSALNTDELHDQMFSTTSNQSITPLEQEPIEPTETPLSPEPEAAATSTLESSQPSDSSAAEPEPQPEPEPVASTSAPNQSS